MNNKSSLAKGALVLSIAGILSKVISILYTPMLKVILGQSGYGVYCQVLEVFLFVYAITTVGAQPAVAKVIAEYKALNNEKRVKNTLKVSLKLYFTIGLIGSLLLAVLSIPISMLIGNNVVYGILALSPCVLITCILSAFRGFMQGNHNMKVIAISQVIEQFINVIVSLLCAYFFIKFSNNINLGVAGAQVGTSVGALIAVLFIIYSYKMNLKADSLDSDHDKEIRRKIIFYSIPIIISAGLQNFGGIVDMLNVKTRLVSIGLSGSVSDALYGNYGLYKTFIGVPMVIITSISTTILPSITKAHALNDKHEIQSQIKFSYKLTLAVAIPAAIGLSSVADSMYYSLFGNYDGATFLKVGSFILALMAITQIQVSILQGINQFYYILFTYGIGILLKIVLNYIFVSIPSINIYGVLIGNCAWYLVPAILNHIKMRQITSVKANFAKIIFIPLISSIFMACSIFLFSIPFDSLSAMLNNSRLIVILGLCIKILIGGIVYGTFMILLRGIVKEDIENFSPRLLKLIPSFIRKRLA